MTPQEAIKHITECGLNIEQPLHDAVLECMVNALEKQIPEKPIPADEQNIRYSMNYICPECGKRFSGTGIADYCYHCGQALDWSEENE